MITLDELESIKEIIDEEKEEERKNDNIWGFDNKPLDISQIMKVYGVKDPITFQELFLGKYENQEEE